MVGIVVALDLALNRKRLFAGPRRQCSTVSVQMDPFSTTKTKDTKVFEGRIYLAAGVPGAHGIPGRACVDFLCAFVSSR